MTTKEKLEKALELLKEAQATVSYFDYKGELDREIEQFLKDSSINEECEKEDTL